MSINLSIEIFEIQPVTVSLALAAWNKAFLSAKDCLRAKFQSLWYTQSRLLNFSVFLQRGNVPFFSYFLLPAIWNVALMAESGAAIQTEII